MDLLLAHDEGGGPLLSEDLDETSAADEASPVDVHQPAHLDDISAAASDLAFQRWALVVPEGSQGQRLVTAVQELVTRRTEDQRRDVLIIRVPPGMDRDRAVEWKDRVFPELHGRRQRDKPRYLCILGDVDQVSLATQQVLAVDGFPGRVVCPDEQGYEAYASKIVTGERSPSRYEQARSLFYTVHDGTAATASGYRGLIQPCYELCKSDRETDRRAFPAHDVIERGTRHGPDPDELLDLVSGDHPSVLLSVSHGMGPPRARSWTPEQARQRQGAMQFGDAGALLPRDVATSAFLPGGMWLYFACFGAGTPSRSAYHHWLRMLDGQGMDGLAPLCSVLSGLATDGGFTSGVAQAALANPRGPATILGHMDLAWSYAYQDLPRDRASGRANAGRGRNRAGDFAELIAALIRGERAGVMILALQRLLAAVGDRLNGHYDRQKRQGSAADGDTPAERLALGNLWMRRQDLHGYVLLGDPAARLPLAAPKKTSRSERRARVLPGFVAPAGRRTGAGASYRAGSPAENSSEAQPDDRLDAVEQTLLELATGAIKERRAAQRLGVSREQARKWAQDYRDAGRAVLRRLLARTLQDE